MATRCDQQHILQRSPCWRRERKHLRYGAMDEGIGWCASRCDQAGNAESLLYAFCQSTFKKQKLWPLTADQRLLVWHGLANTSLPWRYACLPRWFCQRLPQRGSSEPEG